MIIDDLTRFQGVSEGGAFYGGGFDGEGYIGPIPALDKKAGNYGCLVRVTLDDGAVSYLYKSLSLDGEVAEAVVAGKGLPEAVRTALEGEVVPGTELFHHRSSYHRTHKEHLKYAASHLNNGGAQPVDIVDSAFGNARDLVEAVIALTAPVNATYGTSVCNF